MAPTWRRTVAPSVARAHQGFLGCAGLAAGVLALVLALAAGASGGSESMAGCLAAPTPSAPSVAPSGPLNFGIYPGGPVGTVSQTRPPVAEDPGRRLRALLALRGDELLTARLYDIYTGDAGADALDASTREQIAQDTAAGLQVELIDEYRPTDAAPASAVPAFAEWVRATVRTYASNPGVTSLQVTNEANQPGSPGTSDGAYPGATDALIRGIEAAHAERTSDGDTRLRIGFSWAYGTGPEQIDFFAALRLAGSTFSSAVDWVGADVYPGVWNAPADTPAAAATVMVSALRQLRRCYLPLAGLPQRTTLAITENGYPTGAHRSYDEQEEFLEAEASAVSNFRSEYGVRSYRVFDLRDSNSQDPDFESQYGLLRDDYTPKPAYHMLYALIQRLSQLPADADDLPIAHHRGTTIAAMSPRPAR